MAKKGNNFLYVNSGQMVAEAEESGNPDHCGPRASMESFILGTAYARAGQPGSQRLIGKTPSLFWESGKSPARGVTRLDRGLVTGLSPAVSDRASLICFPFDRHRGRVDSESGRPAASLLCSICYWRDFVQVM